MADRATRIHAEDLRDQIARILDPKFASQAAAAVPATVGRPSIDSLDCWHDYQMEQLR